MGDMKDINKKELDRCKKQKLLQHDIASELESLTFDELVKIAMAINKFYSKSNGKHTIVINCFNYI